MRVSMHTGTEVQKMAAQSWLYDKPFRCLVGHRRANEASWPFLESVEVP